MILPSPLMQIRCKFKGGQQRIRSVLDNKHSFIGFDNEIMVGYIVLVHSHNAFFLDCKKKTVLFWGFYGATRWIWEEKTGLSLFRMLALTILFFFLIHSNLPFNVVVSIEIYVMKICFFCSFSSPYVVTRYNNFHLFQWVWCWYSNVFKFSCLACWYW